MSNPDPLWQLVYVSSATPLCTEAELLKLLQVSRQNNVTNGITGLLLYKNESFMQLLEGRQSAVHATFIRLSNDPRHTQITLLHEEAVPHRDFQEWSMSFEVIPADAAQHPAVSNFLQTPRREHVLSSDYSNARRLLSSFRIHTL